MRNVTDIRVLGGILEPNTKGAVYEYTPPKGSEGVVATEVIGTVDAAEPDETSVMKNVDVYGPPYWTALTDWEGKTDADRAMQHAAALVDLDGYFGSHRRGGSVATRIVARHRRDEFFAELSKRTDPIHLAEMSEIVASHADDRLVPRETKLVPIKKSRSGRFFFWVAWVGSVLVTSAGLTFITIGLLPALTK